MRAEKNKNLIVGSKEGTQTNRYIHGHRENGYTGI